MPERNAMTATTHAVTLIAEAGVNHNGDVNLAYKLIDVAVEAGADLVKTVPKTHAEFTELPKRVKAPGSFCRSNSREP